MAVKCGYINYQNKTNKPRATEMWTVGVGYAGAGYRVWDPKSNTVVVSRDITFDETNYMYDPNETNITSTEVIQIMSERIENDPTESQILEGEDSQKTFQKK